MALDPALAVGTAHVTVTKVSPGTALTLLGAFGAVVEEVLPPPPELVVVLPPPPPPELVVVLAVALAKKIDP